jgi:hypothetical protein
VALPESVRQVTGSDRFPTVLSPALQTLTHQTQSRIPLAA